VRIGGQRGPDAAAREAVAKARLRYNGGISAGRLPKEAEMPRALVTYYSRSGNTRKMAELVAEALRGEGGVEVDLRPVEQVSADDLLSYDGLLLGSPTYYGTMAWPVKKLLDESVKHHGKLEGKVGAAFCSSANLAGGNETTILDILNALLIHGMVVQGNSSGDHYGPVALGAPDRRATESCRELGARTARLLKKLA
jgi:NAD(P)H dehydrogenase (quinone)